MLSLNKLLVGLVLICGSSMASAQSVFVSSDARSAVSKLVSIFGTHVGSDYLFINGKTDAGQDCQIAVYFLRNDNDFMTAVNMAVISSAGKTLFANDLLAGVPWQPESRLLGGSVQGDNVTLTGKDHDALSDVISDQKLAVQATVSGDRTQAVAVSISYGNETQVCRSSN